MSLVLNTNISSMVAQNSLTSSGSQLATSLQQLSSGLRINTAADDAAGYAIVQGMTSQINGINQAAKNANDGVSLAQTGSGALTEITNDLQTMRDLAVQSLNATNSSSDRADLDSQFQQLKADINSVATQTQFNGVNLLDGSFQGATFQVGANAGQSITVSSIASANSNAIGNYYNSTVAAAGTVKTANSATPVTTTAGTAGSYNATTLGGATGLNTAVAGSTVTLGVSVDGTAYSTGAVTLTGTAATDLKSLASAINQAIGTNTGVVATVNATGTGISLSGTASNGDGHVVNFSVASATNASGAAATPSTATLASLGVDSSDIIGTYTASASAGTAAVAASSTTALTGGGTAGSYSTANVAAAFNGAGTVSAGTPGSVTLSVTVNGTTTSTGAIVITGAAATDLAAEATAINAQLAGTGLTAAANGTNTGLTFTGGTENSVVSFAVTAATAADSTAATPALADLGIDSSDTTTFTPAVAAVPASAGGVTTSSATQYASGLDVKTVDDSNQVLISIDNALQQLANTGAQLGAYQNRFASAVTGLNTDSTNLTSARSQIQDTDYAQATSSLSKAQILQQASTAMVAQANTIPQNILTLLQKLP